MESRSVVCDGVGIAHMGHPTAPNLTLDSRLSHPINSGDPLVSPRWRFYGFGSRLGSNEKVEMTMSASGQTGRGPLGAHLRFLPWLCLTWGGLEPFVG